MRKKHLTTSRFTSHLLCYFSLTPIVFLLALWIGSEKINWVLFWNNLGKEEGDITFRILFHYRLPRIILGFLAGGSLALAGGVFQAILRNDLATPYTLGITSGGTLGAVLAISFPALSLSWGIFSSVQIFALLGAALTTFLVYLLAHRQGSFSMSYVLLVGITVGIFCNAHIMLVRYLVSPNTLVIMDRWIMGGLSTVGYQDIWALLPLLLPGLFLLFLQCPQLNLLAFGEEMATGYGINVSEVQKNCFIGGCLVTASVVSITGTIGFVGLIVPHLVRKIVGPDNRLVLPGAFFLGGNFLVLCDIFARTIIAPTEMPVGIITSCLGSPIFIWILLRSSNK